MYALFPPNHICNRAIEDIIEIQKPLNSMHGLHLLYFGRYYQNNAGFIFYTNKPYFSIRCALNVPFVATYLNKSIHPWHEIHSNDFVKIAEDFNIFNPINIINKIENGQEAITFAFSTPDNPGVSFYLNHLDMLHKFIDFFKVRAAHLINEAEKYRINVPPHLAAPSKQNKSQYDETIKQLMTNFALPNDLNQQENPLHLLTKKEFLCLCYYLMGKTAAEIAARLKLSPKTVSAHIYNVRQKLKCKNRSELFKRAWDLGLISSTIIDVSKLDE